MNFIPAVQPADGPTPAAWYFIFCEGRLLLPDDEAAPWQALVRAPVAVPADVHYLGRLDGFDCWAFTTAEVPDGWRALPLRAAMMRFPGMLMAAAGRAAQVLEWDRTHRFCGVCATPTAPHPSERSRRCPNCGQVVYPRVSPAMMVLIWRGSELLLARAPTFAPGMYSALAGFVEAGESIEDCVHREVAEEVGVQVADLRYYGSQSWPFPNSLMIAYTARWTGGEIVPQPDEIEAAGWFGLDALPGIPPRFSIAGHLIRDSVEAMRQGLRPGRQSLS